MPGKSRMNVAAAAPEVYRHLMQLEKLVAAKLEPRLLHLLKLRASQINGCAYCIGMHTDEALRDGETTERLTLLDAWPEVVRRVRGAQLVLAGRGMDAGASMGVGVRAIGPVPTAMDALSHGSVFAFPCPASSGPKVTAASQPIDGPATVRTSNTPGSISAAFSTIDKPMTHAGATRAIVSLIPMISGLEHGKRV